jgi:hypothetical protein
MVTRRDSGVQAPCDGMAPRTASFAIQASSDTADAAATAVADTRELAVQVGVTGADSESETMLARQKLVLVEEDVVLWRSRAESADSRQAEAGSRA